MKLEACPAFFFVRHQGRCVKIVRSEITVIEASRNYCKIHTATGVQLALVTLKRLALLLPPREFVRIHRAYIVNLNWIQSFDHRQVYGPDRKLPIGEIYAQQLRDRVCILGESRRGRNSVLGTGPFLVGRDHTTNIIYHP